MVSILFYPVNILFNPVCFASSLFPAYPIFLPKAILAAGLWENDKMSFK
jgi:hypothetical protein